MRIAIIPAYEPDEKLIVVAETMCESGFYVLVVDDGSGEEYASIFDRTKGYAEVISYKHNRGKGYALKTAYRHIAENYRGADHTIVTMDCDGQHTVEDTIRVCEKCEENPEALVLGGRTQSKASPLRSRFGNGMTRVVFHLTTGVKINDTQTGLRAFKSRFLQLMLGVSGYRYEYEMNVLMRFAHDHIPMIEIPIETIYINDNQGSHFHPVRDSFIIYREILRFSLSSLTAFAIDYVCYTIFLNILPPHLLTLANVLARCCSSTVNFLINYKLVFKSDEKLSKSLIKYIGNVVLILGINTLLLYVLVTVCKINPYIAKVIVEMSLFIVNFTIQRAFVFNDKPAKKDS